MTTDLNCFILCLRCTTAKPLCYIFLDYMSGCLSICLLAFFVMQYFILCHGYQWSKILSQACYSSRIFSDMIIVAEIILKLFQNFGGWSNYILVSDVVTCEIKHWNNFETVSVFYFTCNHGIIGGISMKLARNILQMNKKSWKVSKVKAVGATFVGTL